MNCEHLCLKPRIHGIGVGPRSPASETALQPQADRLGVHALMHVGVPVRVCTEPVLTSTAAAALENDDVHDFYVASMLSMAAKAQLRASVMIRVGDECTCTYTHRHSGAHRFQRLGRRNPGGKHKTETPSTASTARGHPSPFRFSPRRVCPPWVTLSACL